MTFHDCEELAKTTPYQYRMNLLKSKIEIMPVHYDTTLLFHIKLQGWNRWNITTYPPVAPNFVAGIRLRYNTADDVHNKMRNGWMRELRESKKVIIIIKQLTAGHRFILIIKAYWKRIFFDNVIQFYGITTHHQEKGLKRIQNIDTANVIMMLSMRSSEVVK
ncbi:hypothetical protein C1645_734540 [Glomus cerebriforme]|uniref:Uncharacterized protein n=1 Tax=Glomus cerebriforme TaxID=658196 RepID=A0A397TE51_9GLOM|nr:hypothetical protein C1645_734540 [Glomus cerebriforme]